jgi:hypothetical protein
MLVLRRDKAGIVVVRDALDRHAPVGAARCDGGAMAAMAAALCDFTGDR